MANGNEEFDGKVHTSMDGSRFASVATSYGKIRVNESPAIKQVNLCLLDGSLKQKCLIEISYSRDAGPGVIPGLHVNGAPLIDMEALGPELGNTMRKALSGVSITRDDAENIGRLSAEIGDRTMRQRGVGLN